MLHLRSSLAAARRAVVASLLLAGCHRAPARPPLVEKGDSVAKVFETSQPYSKRVIDSTHLAVFFAAHPEYRGDSTSLVDFYRSRGMQFAWMLGDSLSASAEAFIEMADAPDSAAPTIDSVGTGLRAIHDAAVTDSGHATLCDSCVVDLELRLTAEFFRFADRRYNGYLSRDLRDLNWFIPRAKKNLTQLLDSMATGQFDISAYEPVHPQYPLLKTAIVRYRTLADSSWPALALPASMRKLSPGDSAEVIGAIRHRLYLLGDLTEEGSGNRLDRGLVTAVKRFQDRHGLASDGVLATAFVTAINVTPTERLRTMLINIERLRWVPERQPPNLILVNIPEFRLHVYENGEDVLNMRVVVGARATHTVVFSDTLSKIVFSPSWTVPMSITKAELLPAMQRDKNYLRKHNMEIIGGSKTLPIIRQKPGPDNSLGLVKFIFPNSFGIYFHDTPARSLFSASERALSHGCIRLSHPRELAAYLLRDDSTWTAAKIDAAMHAGKELFVPLQEKRPVLIAYFTAWVDAQGRLNFRDDVYGHDARLGAELFAGADSVAKPGP